VAAAGNLANVDTQAAIEVRVLRVGRDANQSALVKPDQVSSAGRATQKAR
jgi:hypothetical protein